MRAPTPILVVGFSGPDGSGKSSACDVVAHDAASRGHPVVRTYLYGCLACRHVRPPAALRAATCGRGPLSWESGGEPRPGTPPTHLHRVHALVDAAEAAVRLLHGLSRARRLSRRTRRTVLLLADRTPLDGLVKHDLPAENAAVRLFTWLMGRFTVIALLDAPADLLSLRDGEHHPGGLERARIAYRRRAAALPGVTRFCSGDRSPDQLSEDLFQVLLRPRADAPTRTPP